MVSTLKHGALAGDPTRESKAEACGSQAKVEQGVVVGGIRVVLLDYGEDVKGEPAGERKGELIKRRQAGQEMRRHDDVSVSVFCSSSSEEVSVQQAQKLDPKSRATSSVWCAVAPNGGAYPSCVALLRRRLRRDASGWPSAAGRIRSCIARLRRRQEDQAGAQDSS